MTFSPIGRFQGTPNPRDPRYRTDQPLPVGTRVLVYSGSETDGIEWLIDRYGTRELIAEILDVGQTTFLGYVPIVMQRRLNGGRPEELQWPVDGLRLVEGLPDDLEAWLDS